MNRPSFAIYDASAGSGKTYALVKEYLKIILTSKKDDAYRNILAITFTNKAVHEMKSRIVGSLSEFVKEEPSSKAEVLMMDLVTETKLSREKIKTKSKQIIKHIIHNYAAFDISTIDKFTHKVIRAFAHDLNLPMTFEVSLDSENLLTEAVDAIIDQVGEEDMLTNLLVDFTMEKTDDDKSWDISREIFETGRLILNENNRNEITFFENKSISDFLISKKKLGEACKVLEGENSQLAKEVVAILEKNTIDLKSFSGGHFPNHLQSIIKGNFNPRNKTYHEFDDIKINKTAKDRAIIEGIIPDLLQKLEIIYKNFEKRDFYKAFLKNITPLSLLNRVSSELAKIQDEQNILSISEFNSIIHHQIQNQPAPFIYERLGERYRHFFIDEFQDTSEMQWQNLIPLIDNATSSEIDGEKGTLMIVGDPKQSIYRWRGGKAEQFIELSKNKNPFNNPDKKLEHLDKNYRSYSQIIEFNNGFFKLLSTEFENPDYKELYEKHTYQKSNDKIGGYVNISFLPKSIDIDEDSKDKTTQYLEATVKTIRKIEEQGFEYRDVVILTRKREQGISVANYLTEQGIPIVSSETLMIQNATEVHFIINTLKYLNNSSDKEAKANFLFYIARYIQHEIPVHDFIAKGMEEIDERTFEDWLATVVNSISFQDIRKKSLYEAVEIIISKFIDPKNKTAYVHYFLDIVIERDVRNQSGISDFLKYWDKNSEKFSIPSPEGKNAVRIMTVHKSKGLEFPIVILPFADEDYTKKPKDKLWLNAEEETFGLPKVLIDNSSAIVGYGEDAKMVYEQKKQEDLLDNINVLYVALTRAEEQLYIISRMVETNKEGVYPDTTATFFVKYLIDKNDFDENKLEYQFGSAVRLSVKSDSKDETKLISLVNNILNPVNIKIAQKESLMWGTHQQKAIEYGNLIHEIIALVKTKEDIDSAITQSIENGLIVLAQKETVRRTICEIVFHPDLLECFSEENLVLNEQTIIQKEGTIIKPDRMVLTQKNEVLLLDYKTGIHNSKHQSQLENYKRAIEKMGYKVIKKALVYIGEDINVVNFN
jgi:ATP-dependent exoDNAse (exonuclease V) beta subunit